eukprot:jgi/Chrpa1/24382/Chrysochromulina_OHIO_Genome00023675-RA
MDINYPTPSSLEGTAVVTAFTHFNSFTASLATSSTCLVSLTGQTSTGYKLRHGNTSTAETLAYGTTYRLVYQYDSAIRKCSVWVNPTSEASTRIMTVNTVAADTTISAVAFRQASATPPWTLSIRNLIVAATFAEACPPYPPSAPPSPPPPSPSPPPPSPPPPSPPPPSSPPPPPSSPTILVRDNFSTDGNLVGSMPDVGGNWVTNPNSGSGSIAVSQGAINVSSLLNEDLYSAFTSVVSTGTVYAGMDLNYPTPSTTTGTGITYFTHFIVSETTYVCRVFPTGHTSTGYKLGISTVANTAEFTTTAETAYGTTYRLVYSFDTVTDKCSLWVNPTSENSTRILTAAAATTSYTISAVAFRQAPATPPWTLSIRNLIVATTFAEVCPPAPPPPPPLPPSPPPPSPSPPPPSPSPPPLPPSPLPPSPPPPSPSPPPSPPPLPPSPPLSPPSPPLPYLPG